MEKIVCITIIQTYFHVFIKTKMFPVYENTYFHIVNYFYESLFIYSYWLYKYRLFKHFQRNNLNIHNIYNFMVNL